MVTINSKNRKPADKLPADNGNPDVKIYIK
jgi:hypothetical protein